MAWTATNPAVAGKGTLIGDIGAAFQNTLELASGGKALDRLVATPIDITTTGTVNDHNPGAVVIVRCNNASALVFNGIVPFGAGQIRIYENIGTSTVTFAHQNTGSTAANRLLLPSTAGQILGPNGSIGFRYDNTTQRWRQSFLFPGDPITVPHSNTNYNANGVDADWDVASADQVVREVLQWGRIVDDWFSISTSSVANAPTNLRILFPNSWVSTVGIVTPVWINENTTAVIGRAFVQAAIGYIQIEKLNAAAFSNLTDLTSVHGHIRYKIN